MSDTNVRADASAESSGAIPRNASAARESSGDQPSDDQILSF